MHHAISACLAAALAFPASTQNPAAGPQGGTWTLRSITAPHGGCITAAQRARIVANVARWHAVHAVHGTPSLVQAGVVQANAVPVPWAFVPQAGNTWDDVLVPLWVDLDPTPNAQAWTCTNDTYEGHQGHDRILRTFAEQDLEVPVFAAADGVVVDLHDGEFDRQTSNLPLPANYVVLYHGGTQYSWYLHLRKNSLAVQLGQRVAAGTQLGLTGSSGKSAWPHLHFESHHQGQAYEPSAGPCRGGPSYWVNQEQDRQSFFVSDFAFGDVAFETLPFLPDRYPATGTIVQGTRSVGMWWVGMNLPPQSTFRVRCLRPDRSVAHDTGVLQFQNPQRNRLSWGTWRRDVPCNVLGTWSLELSVNNAVAAVAPFEVVATPAQVVQRPPRDLATIRLDPAQPRLGDVVFCRVTTPPVADPDYDVVRFEYDWTVDGKPVRKVTTAAHADALPWDAMQPGSVVRCVVTPLDAARRATPAPVQTTVAAAPCLHLAFAGAGHADGSGDAMAIPQATRDVVFTAQPAGVAAILLSTGALPQPFAIPQLAACGGLAAAWLHPDPMHLAWIVLPGAQLSVPPGFVYDFFVQGLQLVPSGTAGSLCLVATSAHRLRVGC